MQSTNKSLKSEFIFDSEATCNALAYGELTRSIENLLRDKNVSVPQRIVLPMAKDSSLFVMPAHDSNIAITKIISVLPYNRDLGLPSVQGDILVFDIHTGRRIALLDGPTVTARRTAAVSLLAAQRLAPTNRGPMLIVGAGDQGKAHLEAFQEVIGVEKVFIYSRTKASADTLVLYANKLGIDAQQIDDPNQALAYCSLVISATPALEVVLTKMPREGAFISAVGAYKPNMAEWSAPVCQELAKKGTLVVDTRDADHEAGDFLQAGIHVPTIPCLSDVVCNTATWLHRESREPTSSIFFKNCGWAGWDLAAARCIAKAIKQ